MPRHGEAELDQPLLHVSRPASPSLPSTRGPVEVTGTYDRDMSTVNYVDVEFELNGGDPEHGLEPTDTIQPFVQAVCDVRHQDLAHPRLSSNVLVLTCCWSWPTDM